VTDTDRLAALREAIHPFVCGTIDGPGEPRCGQMARLIAAGVTFDPRPAPDVVVKFSADATPEEVEMAREQIESLFAPLDVDRLAESLFNICAACEPGEEDNHHRRHAEAIAREYVQIAPADREEES
jgi:hypothetical protein